MRLTMKDADSRNFFDSLKIRILNPEFPGNQKNPMKIQEVIIVKNPEEH